MIFLELGYNEATFLEIDNKKSNDMDEDQLRSAIAQILSNQKKKKRAFISFDFDNDEFLRTAIIGQAKNEDSPFDISDWSVQKPFTESTWEQKVLARIKQTDVVIVMVGERTYTCEGVLKEIAMAKIANVPYFGIQGYSDKNCPVPYGLETIYQWTWPNIKLLIDGNR